MTTLPMLDFSRLQTPPDHGRILVEPEPAGCVEALRTNYAYLRASDVPLAGSTLARWRRRTRKAVVGTDDALVTVVGHQPAFVHPGVWAKHIVATRLSSAVDGIALNLVVDCDAPTQTILSVPAVGPDGIQLRSVPFARLASGFTFEQIQRSTREQAANFERTVRDALGDRYETSQMPTFVRGFADADPSCDWTAQAVAGRRAIEANLGVVLRDRRVSEVWGGPLLADMLVNAPRFAASYNRALKEYRRVNRVRGKQRPIPDLHCDQSQCEVAAWAYRSKEGRRRLFVTQTGDSLRLLAGEEEIAVVCAKELIAAGDVRATHADFNGWRFRPRALTLTIWARLLLADLFIHGIGGAKYDRISDAIIQDYYGLTPPQMACASATLHLKLPRHVVTPESVRHMRHNLRDLIYNPQRHVCPDRETGVLIAERSAAVRRAADLRRSGPTRRQARRDAFVRIRDLNAEILSSSPETLAAGQAQLAKTLSELQQNQIALGREYFFGLFDRAGLEQLLGALPGEHEFRV